MGEWRGSPEGKPTAESMNRRFWPQPHGSVQDICRQLDEWVNAGLGEPRDIRERP